MKKFNVCSVISLFSIVLFSACADKNADPAPISQAGLKGDVGVSMVTTSATNIVYSQWIYAKDGVDSTINGTNLNVAHINSSIITPAMLAKGTVLLYAALSDSTKSYALPYTNYADDVKANTIGFIPSAGKLIVTRFTFDNSNDEALSSQFKYKVIIVPEGDSANGRTYQSDLALLSYADVCKTLGIPQ